jgi:hypothetical protein
MAAPGPAARGVSYWLGSKLYVSVTDRVARPGLATLLSLRGPGFRMPGESGFAPLGGEEPSAEQVAAVVDAAYASDPRKAVGGMGEDDTGVTFAGLGEPLVRLDEVARAARLVLERRHGVPLRVKTSGVLPADGGSVEAAVAELQDAGIGFLSVSLPAAEPRRWARAMQVGEDQGARLFGGVCDLVSQAAAAGLQVECVAVAAPGVDAAAVRQLAQALGAVNTRIVSFVL